MRFDLAGVLLRAQQQIAESRPTLLVGAMCRAGKHDECRYDDCRCEMLRIEKQNLPCWNVHSFGITHGGSR